MRFILAACLLARTAAAATPYDAAGAAIKSLGPAQIKEVEAFLARPSSAGLDSDARAAALVEDNAAALDAFRAAAEARSDGYVFGPRPERLDASTPIPQFFATYGLFRLVLLDARINLARRRRAPVERDLRAAAGFMVQLSEQKFGAMISALVLQLCVERFDPVLRETLRKSPPGAAAARELRARLDRVAGNFDFMRAGLAEEGEIQKGGFRQMVNAGAIARAIAGQPLLQRLVSRRMLDAELLALADTLSDEEIDARTRVYQRAFRENAPDLVDAFYKREFANIAARKKEREARGSWGLFLDDLAAGSAARRRLADVVVDKNFGISLPGCDKMIERYYACVWEVDELRGRLAALPPGP